MPIQERLKMRERKKEFVQGALYQCLKEVDPNIDDVCYSVVESEEIVAVNYKQGVKVVLVTACSLAGIVKEVIKVIS